MRKIQNSLDLSNRSKIYDLVKGLSIHFFDEKKFTFITQLIKIFQSLKFDYFYARVALDFHSLEYVKGNLMK